MALGLSPSVTSTGGSYDHFIKYAKWWAAVLSVVFVAKSVYGFCVHKYPVYKRQLFGGEIVLGSPGE